MKALVTGVAGFIGSRLASFLLALGHEVTGLDSFTTYYDADVKRRNLERIARRPRFTMVEADLASEGWQNAALPGVEVIFHQAGQPGVRASWDIGFAEYAERNVIGTQCLLEAAKAHAEAEPRFRRLVYASSSSIYGDALTFPTHEGLVPAPFSPYGVTKLAAEHLCGVYARNWGLPTISLRYFTVYGGGQRPDMALHRMINAALEGTKFPRFGDGTQRRDYTHVDDVVRANLLAAESTAEPGEVVNIAGGSDATVADLLRLVEASVGRPVVVDQKPAQPGDVARTGGDTTKARQLLGWKPEIALDEGIREQVAWQRNRR